jgi:hypothetical protein
MKYPGSGRFVAKGQFVVRLLSRRLYHAQHARILGLIPKVLKM